MQPWHETCSLWGDGARSPGQRVRVPTGCDPGFSKGSNLSFSWPGERGWVWEGQASGEKGEECCRKKIKAKANLLKLGQPRQVFEMICASFMKLISACPLAFFNILLFCKACSAHESQSWCLSNGRNKLVSQEPLPCSVLVQFSSPGFYIAFGSSQSADFPANEDVLHSGRAVWNENHIYFMSVVTGCPSLVYADLAFWGKGHRAYLAAFSACGLKRVT